MYGYYSGIHGDVMLSGEVIPSFEIYPLEFRENFTECW